ncbi:FecR family protein [Lentimicrobium sp. S6]|uniref:FecR family protein n=1 Tax=Lentimicrobium sp. S6 TaxID=2735872 RepID=UPI001557AF89|nr:FecR domain-containing protein [Lentimicrobium sp. S6]NPD47414.1 DUF4974 domain-containing protein [Lentimicrobium sp. S6]
MDYKLEDFILDDSFVNYATNKNQADIAKWEEWFSQNPKNLKIALDAKMLIHKLRFHKQELPKEFISEEWHKLSTRLHLNEIKRKNKGKTIFLKKIGRYAAAASILLFLASAIYYFSNSSIRDAEPIYQELCVAKGASKNIILPDGTVVFINSDSKLKYEENFEGASREVFLEGEAWFDVSHNANKPFIVHTQENDIRVLGTAFNVYAYPNENVFRTSLERGSISLSYHHGAEIELKVNQTYILHKNTQEIKLVETDNIEIYSAWKDGEIVFKNQKFTEILKTLERTHNLTFILQNKNVGKCNYTGCFTTEDDINSILAVIKLPTPFEYEIHNDTVIIK